MTAFGKRILILIPHPDDEVVGFSAALGRARTQGAEIFALYITNGCIARATLWPWQRKHHAAYVVRRRKEGEDIARFLRMTPVGWNDARPARHLWPELSAVHAEIAAAVDAHNIDQLWVPAYEGGNADHDGVNAVASCFMPQLSVLEFAEYNFCGGKAHSQEFPFPNGSEVTLTLTPAEQETKRKALALYVSEQMNLNYVKLQRECFRPLASYDYSQPPHNGKLWYARFQWVPFRHPRVDFTDPAEVSATITAFLDRMRRA
jgi:LmbE family N-acetylglucosaminyl deacetylase